MDSATKSFLIRTAIWFGLGLIVLIMALSGSELAHGATSAPKRGDNGLGVVISSDNPYMYNMGVVAHGAIMRDDRGRDYTSIDFAPYGRPMIFPEGILLCGNQAKPLMEHQLKVVVLTYERQAHTMYQGIGCHELVSINEVTE